MIPKEAIEKAIEGGWLKPDVEHYRTRLVNPDEPIRIGSYENRCGQDFVTFLGVEWNLAVIALDPKFWQALGKALGWREPISDVEDSIMLSRGVNLPMYRWQWWAMRFYDLILTNGDTEAFWRELLERPFSVTD